MIRLYQIDQIRYGQIRSDEIRQTDGQADTGTVDRYMDIHINIFKHIWDDADDVAADDDDDPQ